MVSLLLVDWDYAENKGKQWVLRNLLGIYLLLEISYHVFLSVIRSKGDLFFLHNRYVINKIFFFWEAIRKSLMIMKIVFFSKKNLIWIKTLTIPNKFLTYPVGNIIRNKFFIWVTSSTPIHHFLIWKLG